MYKNEKKKPLERLLYQYPQLVLTPENRLSERTEYIDIVKKGKFPIKLENPFFMSEKDTFTKEKTPIGDVEVYSIYHREDFERIVKILAYKGEDCDIPASIGAVTIRGINNWRKIQAHKIEYIMSGKYDWNKEFKEFTNVKSNYQDTLIILSVGNYSAVGAEKTSYTEDEWIRLSSEIRKYHELAHVVSRAMYPQNVDVIRDELVADCIGLLGAVHDYQQELALKFLGIEDGRYHVGGRLENYIPQSGDVISYLPKVKEQVQELKKFVYNHKTDDIFSLLIKIEEKKIAF